MNLSRKPVARESFLPAATRSTSCNIYPTQKRLHRLVSISSASSLFRSPMHKSQPARCYQRAASCLPSRKSCRQSNIFQSAFDSGHVTAPLRGSNGTRVAKEARKKPRGNTDARFARRPTPSFPPGRACRPSEGQGHGEASATSLSARPIRPNRKCVRNLHDSAGRDRYLSSFFISIAAAGAV